MEKILDWIKRTGTNVPQLLQNYEPTGTRDKNIPNKELETILNAYYRDVVARERSSLPLPALLVFDGQYMKILHDKSNSWTKVVQKLDDFANQFNQKSMFPDMFQPSRLLKDFPDMKLHVTKELVSGETDNSKADWRIVRSPVTHGLDAVPMYGRCSGPPSIEVAPNKLMVHPESLKEFERGGAGSSWVGIAQIGGRCYMREDWVYLVPSAPVVSHMSNSHGVGLTITPVVHGEVSSHNGALAVLMQKGWINIPRDSWNGQDYDKLVKEGAFNTTGIFFGFSLVKRFSARGHHYAFTSVTLNKYACSTFKDLDENIFQEETARQEQGNAKFGDKTNDVKSAQVSVRDRAKQMKSMYELNKMYQVGARKKRQIDHVSSATDVAQDWAIEIWKATRNLL